MHKILILNRTKAIAYSYHAEIDDSIIVSINDDKKAHFDRSNSKIKGVCSLFFHDIEFQTENGILMSDEDANAIKRFIDLHKDNVNTIVVHCYAGISRSSAVACAISMYLNGNDKDIWGTAGYFPNQHCYRTTLKAFGIALSEDEIQERYDLNEKAFDESENADIIKSMFI